jgi:PAS domain S-box-containing protein
MSRKQSDIELQNSKLNRFDPAAQAVDQFQPGIPAVTGNSAEWGNWARLLASLEARLLNTSAESLDEHIRQTLSDLGNFTEADSCYLFRFSIDGTTVIKGHFWGAGEAIPGYDQSGGRIEDFPIALTSLRWHEVGHRVPDGVPDDILAERHRLFGESGIRSLVNIPLLSRNGVIGALGISTAHSSLDLKEDGLTFLKLLGHVVADTLARIRLEAELRTSKQGFIRLISGLDEVMYRMSLSDGEYQYMGPAAEAVFGYSTEEFRSNPELMRALIHPDFREQLEMQWTDALKGRVHKSCEYKIIDRDGRGRWVHQSNNLLFDDRGRPTAVEGICRNITEQKAAEEVLRASEERFRAITENAADIVLIMSAQGELQYITPSVERILGYVPHDILGKTFTDFINPDDLTLALQTLDQTLSNPSETLRLPDLRVAHNDGQWLWFEGLVSNLIENSAVKGLVVNCRDITRRKQTEAAYKRVQDHLEERVQERTRELAETNARLKREQEALEKRTVALQEVLGQVEAGRNELATQTQANVDKIALPILDALNRTGNASDEHYLRLLRSCLKDITAPLAHYLDRTFPELSPREQEISHMVKDGLSSKDIAATLHISAQTVVKQRKTIRRKLGLSNRKINLASFLRSLG